MEGRGKEAKWACMAYSPTMLLKAENEAISPIQNIKHLWWEGVIPTISLRWRQRRLRSEVLRENWISLGPALLGQGLQLSCLRSRNQCGELHCRSQLWLQRVVLGKQLCHLQQGPHNSVWTDNLLILLENCEFSFQASRQGYCKSELL